MNSPDFPHLRPGASPTARDFNALADAVSGLGYVGGGGDIGTTRGFGGTQFLDGREKGHWAKLGVSSGAAYAHVTVASNGDGTFTDITATPEFSWGTAADQPAWEVNGAEGIASGTIVWIWPEPRGLGWLFDAGSSLSPAAECRDKLIGLSPCSCVTGTVTAGTGGCANVAAATVAFSYDAAAGGADLPGWVSSAFTTAAGATVAAVWVDATGNVVGKLTAGSDHRPLTFVRCQGGGLLFVSSDCLFCSDAWATGCDGNKFYLLVDCGCPTVCDEAVEIPPVLDFWIDSGPYAFASAANPIKLYFGGYIATAPGGFPFNFPDYRGAYRVWGGGANFGSTGPGGFGGENGYYVVLYSLYHGAGICMTLEVWRAGLSIGSPVQTFQLGARPPHTGSNATDYWDFSLAGVPGSIAPSIRDGTTTFDNSACDPCGTGGSGSGGSSPPPPPPPPPPPAGTCCTDTGEVFHSSTPALTGTGVTPSIAFTYVAGYWEGGQSGAATTYWYFYCESDTWKLARFIDGAASGPVDAASADCTTGVFVFAGTAFGAGGDITVSV